MESLYLITSGIEGFVKIGIAKDVESRIASLQTGNPYELELLACFDFRDASFIEKALHQKCDENHVRGEWYRLSAAQVDEIKSICVSLGGVENQMQVKVGNEEIEDAEENQHTEDILIGGINWRLEKRNDRNPPGYAIFQRGGEKKYLGYAGIRSLKNPHRPTVEEIESVILENARNES